MPLARGEGRIEPEAIGATSVVRPALVIAVASTPQERLRLARVVGEHAALMLVASPDEAIALLLEYDRTGPAAAPSPTPELSVDSDLRTAEYHGRCVPLSPLEHDLLSCLLSEVGHTWPFDALHREIWGNGHLGGHADVQSVVKRLRRKLRDLRCPLGIVSVRGVGLRLDDRRAATA